MNILAGSIAATVIGSGLVVAGGGMGNLAGQARHAVNQQVAAAVVSTAQIRSALTAAVVDDGYERYGGALAASESGIVAAMSLNAVDYTVNGEQHYVAFRVPTAPATDCEVRYFQASADAPWRVELVSSDTGCGASSGANSSR